MRLEFTAEVDHEITGELGWKDSRVAWHSPYGPLQGGTGLAHDSLEHFSLATTSDEIEAHAAMYWGRYRGGYMNAYGRGLTLEDFGAEWTGLFQAIASGHDLDIPKRTRKLDDEIEEDISEIMAQGTKYIREENRDVTWQDWKATLEIIRQNFRGWFRTGFRKAEAKFRRMGITPHQMCYLFERLGKRFEQEKCQFEGQKIVLVLNKAGFTLRELEMG